MASLHRWIKRAGAVLGLMCTVFSAGADEAGQFDYYILALSWNAGWCEIEGTRKGAPQCVEERREGFTLHGLWPQYDEGWPQFCRSAKPNPSRAVTKEWAWLYGSSGAAWHQWDKHGRCTGLSYQDYYEQSEALWERFATPEIFMEIEAPLKVAPRVIEEAFEADFPNLEGDEMAVVCKKGVFQEVRICLDQDFEPTQCLGRAAKDCEYSPEVVPSF